LAFGHHSIKIMVDTYGYLMPSGNKAAVDRLNGLAHETIHTPEATTTDNPVFTGRKSS
jgi:hypothetical protein